MYFHLNVLNCESYFATRAKFLFGFNKICHDKNWVVFVWWNSKIWCVKNAHIAFVFWVQITKTFDFCCHRTRYHISHLIAFIQNYVKSLQVEIDSFFNCFSKIKLSTSYPMMYDRIRICTIRCKIQAGKLDTDTDLTVE